MVCLLYDNKISYGKIKTHVRSLDVSQAGVKIREMEGGYELF